MRCNADAPGVQGDAADVCDGERPYVQPSKQEKKADVNRKRDFKTTNAEVQKAIYAGGRNAGLRAGGGRRGKP